MGIALLVAALGPACGKAESPPVVAPVPATTPAGAVEALEGHVTAQRVASNVRILGVRDRVWPDDTVVTGDQASVSIRLLHNNALWLLQAGQTRRVDRAAAWRAPKQATAVALADRPAAPTTESAGRHSEQEAAQTGEAATRPAEKSAADRRQKIVEGIQKNGVLKLLGSQNGNSAALRDVLGNVDGVDNDIANSLSGVGISGTRLDGGGRGGKGAKSHGRVSGGGGGTGGSGSAIGQLDPRLVTDATLQSQLRKGKASKEDLARFVAKARLTIRVAYERALHLNPELKGDVTVVVEVSDGSVTGVSVLSQRVSEELVACVTGPLKRMVVQGMDGVEIKLTVKLAVRH